MAEMIHITAMVKGNATVKHAALCERRRASDDAAIMHDVSPHTLCGKMVGERRVFSNPWEELRRAPWGEGCEECLHQIAQARANEPLEFVPKTKRGRKPL